MLKYNGQSDVTSINPDLANSIFSRGENQMVDSKIARSCSVDGCGRKYYGKGVCNKHYPRSHAEKSEDVPIGCQTAKCFLKDPFGECCGRYWFRKGMAYPNRVVGPHWVDTKTTAVERFWAHVALTADDGRCWNWTGHKTPYGYGLFSIHRDQNLAHRFSWFLAHGERPSQWVLHKCGNTSCVNPKHLYEGTPYDNAQDRIADGTQPRGETHGWAKHTEDEVRRVKQLLSQGVSQRNIQIQMGMSRGTVGDIARARNWKHVTIDDG